MRAERYDEISVASQKAVERLQTRTESLRGSDTRIRRLSKPPRKYCDCAGIYVAAQRNAWSLLISHRKPQITVAQRQPRDMAEDSVASISSGAYANACLPPSRALRKSLVATATANFVALDSATCFASWQPRRRSAYVTSQALPPSASGSRSLGMLCNDIRTSPPRARDV